MGNNCPLFQSPPDEGTKLAPFVNYTFKNRRLKVENPPSGLLSRHMFNGNLYNVKII